MFLYGRGDPVAWDEFLGAVAIENMGGGRSPPMRIPAELVASMVFRVRVGLGGNRPRAENDTHRSHMGGQDVQEVDEESLNGAQKICGRMRMSRRMQNLAGTPPLQFSR